MGFHRRPAFAARQSIRGPASLYVSNEARLPTVSPGRCFATTEGFTVMSRFMLGSCSLTQLAYRFNGRTAQPLEASSPPGYGEPTSLSNFLLLPRGSDYTFTLLTRLLTCNLQLPTDIEAGGRLLFVGRCASRG